MPDGAPVIDELAVLFPAPVTITVDGKPVEIKRCGMGQGSRLVQLGVPLWQAMPEGSHPADLFDDPSDQLRALVAAACNGDREWIAKLDGVDLYAIATKWWEINSAFFVRRLLPSYAAMSKGMQALIGAGPT